MVPSAELSSALNAETQTAHNSIQCRDYASVPAPCDREHDYRMVKLTSEFDKCSPTTPAAPFPSRRGSKGHPCPVHALEGTAV
jgi:hypothetical protein